ncbi:MAG: 1-acyl-sn-glycerol-3-phosphate acyltransferase [Myxococcales bacterium]|nr:1-acyl-sn-glycerol-3-phosphate acyltransferase [Myxococcales bacterium]
MLSRDYLAGYSVRPDPRWEGAVAGLFTRYEDRAGVRHRCEGFAAPQGPVLYASNATAKYDFMTFRSAMRRLGQRVVTVTKAKNYHVAWMRPVLERTGVIPLASRGYVLLVDALATLGRRLDEGEYRRVRDALSGGPSFASEPALRPLLTRPREILGYPFDPRETPYAEAIGRVYAATLGDALRLTREAVAEGYSVHIYPEGTVASRLGVGRSGVMQLAWALGLDVVAAAMSGCPRVFRGATPTLRRGTVTLRFGAPYKPALGALGEDFVPFSLAHEARHRGTLDAETEGLMLRLNALLDPDYQRLAGFESDAARGTRRFL